MATQERGTTSETEVMVAAQKPLIINLKHRKHVNWLSNVIDNEGMGKRSSKSIINLIILLECCIYHKPRAFDESSSSSSSSCSSSDSSDSEGETQQPSESKSEVPPAPSAQ